MKQEWNRNGQSTRIEESARTPRELKVFDDGIGVTVGIGGDLDRCVADA